MERFLEHEGQGVVEYLLIVALIGVIVTAALNSTGTAVNGLVQKVASSLSTVGGDGGPPPRPATRVARSTH